MNSSSTELSISEKLLSNDLLCSFITLGTDYAENTATMLLRRLVY
jgi:hypothetical protein